MHYVHYKRGNTGRMIIAWFKRVYCDYIARFIASVMDYALFMQAWDGSGQARMRM